MANNFGIAEGIMVRNAFRDIKDQQEEDAFEKEYKTHLSGLQAEPEKYKPEKEDYNPKAWHQAQLEHMTLRMEDVQFQEAIFKHQRASLDAQRVNALVYVKQAEAAETLKDIPMQLHAYERAWEEVRDGDDIEFGDASYTITNKLTGQKNTTEFKDQRTMVSAVKIAVDKLSQSREFTQAGMERRAENARLNAEQEPKLLVNEKGEKAWVTRRIDNDTGQVNLFYEVQGIPISPGQVRKAGFTTPAEEKTLAEAAAKRAVAKVAGKPKGVGVGQPHAEEKLSSWYMRVYKVSAEEAADMVREDKAKGNIAKDMEAFMASEILDPEDPEDAKKIKQKRKALQELYKPTQPSTKKARGLPKEEKKGSVPINRLPDPKELTEGQTAGKGMYVIKNGKWTIAK